MGGNMSDKDTIENGLIKALERLEFNLFQLSRQISDIKSYLDKKDKT